MKTLSNHLYPRASVRVDRLATVNNKNSDKKEKGLKEKKQMQMPIKEAAKTPIDPSRVFSSNIL